MKIQFFGCWNMWEIILKSILDSNISPKNIFIKTKTQEKQDKLTKKYKVNSKINYDCDMVILAIKPNQLREINLNQFWKNTLIISIMAWVWTKNIKFDKIIRIMPNTPMQVNKWVIWFFSTKNVNKKELSIFKKIFEKNWVLIQTQNEDDIDKITALSWSWPAYYYLFTEIIENKATKMWFSKEKAKLLAYNTFIWAASLLEKSNISVKKLRKNITSPWWTTQEAIDTLKNNNFNNCLNEAIESAYKKAKFLNN